MIKKCTGCGKFMGISLKKVPQLTCCKCTIELLCARNADLERHIEEYQWDLQTSLSAKFITEDRVWGDIPVRTQ
jgi:hypothetical protein